MRMESLDSWISRHFCCHHPLFSFQKSFTIWIFSNAHFCLNFQLLVKVMKWNLWFCRITPWYHGNNAYFNKVPWQYVSCNEFLVEPASTERLTFSLWCLPACLPACRQGIYLLKTIDIRWLFWLLNDTRYSSWQYAHRTGRLLNAKTKQINACLKKSLMIVLSIHLCFQNAFLIVLSSFLPAINLLFLGSH